MRGSSFGRSSARAIRGSYPTAVRYAQRLRQAPSLWPREQRPGHTLPPVVEPQHKPLTTRRATRLVLKHTRKCTEEDTQLLTALKAQDSRLVAIDLAQDFCVLVRARQPDRFDTWLERATTSPVAPLQRFATGLRADYDAVKAGITLRWSNGPVEVRSIA